MVVTVGSMLQRKTTLLEEAKMVTTWKEKRHF